MSIVSRVKAALAKPAPGPTAIQTAKAEYLAAVTSANASLAAAHTKLQALVAASEADAAEGKSALAPAVPVATPAPQAA
jgi:hypothetical protein